MPARTLQSSYGAYLVGSMFVPPPSLLAGKMAAVADRGAAAAHDMKVGNRNLTHQIYNFT